MKQEHIDRINELARKAKAEGLNETETQERETLRRAYVDDVKASLRQHLDNTYVVDAHGNKTKLEQKH